MGAFIQNTSNKKEEEETLEVSEELQTKLDDTLKGVIELTGLSKSKISKIQSTSLDNKDLINAIISADSKNIKLAKHLFARNSSYYSQFHQDIFNEASLLRIIVNNDEYSYSNAIIKEAVIASLGDFKKNKKIAQGVLKNFVKINTPLKKVEGFITLIGKENTSIIAELNNIYSLEQKKAGNIYKNDIKKNALNLLNIDDKYILEKILKYGIIAHNGDINNGVLKQLKNGIQQLINTSNVKLTMEALILIIAENMGLSKKDLQIESVHVFIESIYNYLSLQFTLEDDSDKKDSENNKTEKQKEKSEEYIDDDLEEDEELLDFCDNNCSISQYGTSYYIITSAERSSVIPIADYKKMTSQSLNNYLNFEKTLQEAGLLFLFSSKNKSGFIQMLKQEFVGFDYRTGMGFSSFYTLQALNKIGNLIGIPKKFYGKDGELGKFDSIETAIDIFRYINTTGKLNDQQIAKGGGGLIGDGASKVGLEISGVIQKNGFNAKIAGDILEKGGYSEPTNNQ